MNPVVPDGIWQGVLSMCRRFRRGPMIAQGKQICDLCFIKADKLVKEAIALALKDSLATARKLILPDTHQTGIAVPQRGWQAPRKQGSDLGQTHSVASVRYVMHSPSQA